ncbi:MFS transporter [Novosphingobium piscinae]|uniref:MFS transporter n=1 Tax=Novosphingobium piscinae TaxID=1507448 RepID=A0A7X1G0T6_9SPHN|nr:MFS transporter [Novosphingobium piscinae]MBC2670578.1 MFS transporter [Novosphingobium piscinae]
MTATAGAEWRRGWPSVALTALGLTCAPATLPVYTLGLFVAPLSAEFLWSRAAIQAAILFSTGLGLVGGPLAGWLVRRYGLRLTVVSGLAGMALSLLLGAAMSGWLWQLYLAYGLMSLLGAGANAVSWSTYVAASFERSRGLALGLALSGTGLSAMLMPRIAEAGLEQGGWRSAYLALAAFVALAVLPLCAVFVPRGMPETPGGDGSSAQARGMDVSHVVRTGRFWLIGLSSACIYMAVGGLIPNLVPALTDRGMSAAQAVGVMGSMGAAIIAGRLAVGILVDRLWAPLVALIVLVPAAIGCLLLNTAQPLLVYSLCAASIGLVTGMEFDMLAFLIGRYFGLRDYARIYGRLYMFLAVSAGIAPMTFGAIYDRTHSYAMPIYAAAALLLAGGAMLLLLRRYPDLSDPAAETVAA